MITEQERALAIRLLEESRETLVEAVAGVTHEEAIATPVEGRWSILGYVEHLAVSDDALVELVKRILQTPPRTESPEERAAREAKVAQTKPARGTVQAPERLHPAGRFATLDEALAGFLAARERTIEFARTTQDDLRSHFAPHPAYGDLDGYQWLVGNAKHAVSHAGHIRELREILAGRT
jgi:hypothetical protein